MRVFVAATVGKGVRVGFCVVVAVALAGTSVFVAASGESSADASTGATCIGGSGVTKITVGITASCADEGSPIENRKLSTALVSRMNVASAAVMFCSGDFTTKNNVIAEQLAHASRAILATARAPETQHEMSCAQADRSRPI
jgi:hypothetical protein